MKTYLKLRLNRVDFVDKGANPGAHITLAKRAPTEDRQMADSKDVLPEGVAKRLADLEAEKVALNERVAKAEAKSAEAEQKANEQAQTVAKMLEDRAKDAALVVAKGLDKLGKVEETAHLLFVAKRTMDADTYAQLEQKLSAANAQLKTSKLFGVLGSDGDAGLASEMDTLVAKRMQEKGEDKGTAMLAVLGTPEGKQAWNAIRGGN